MEKPFREKYLFFILLCFMLLFGLYFLVSKEIFGMPLFIYLIILGTDVVWVNILAMIKAKDAKNWPLILANLTSIKAVEVKYRNASTDWTLEMKYNYKIKEVLYHSNNYNWVDVSPSPKESILKLIDTIKNVETFQVHYNPRNHSESVVVSNISYLYLFGVMGGLVIIGLGLSGIFYYFD
jgi:hypothetical protein